MKPLLPKQSDIRQKFQYNAIIMVLEAHDLSVTFRGAERIHALSALNLYVDQGEFFGLLGPNGAGKTTAMRCFLGLQKPDSGNVKLLNQTPFPGCEIFDRIAYLPEEPVYPSHLTVMETMNLLCNLFRKEISSSRRHAMLERFGLLRFSNVEVYRCSKGMKQKLGLCACLVCEPEVLFLDEPVRGLDPLMIREIRDLLRDLNARGTTIIMNSHTLSEVELLCKSVAVINRGSLVVQDSINNLVSYEIDSYSVLMDYSETLPEWLKKLDRLEGKMLCQSSANDIGKVFAWASENNLMVYECSLKKASLEEVLYSFLREGGKH